METREMQATTFATGYELECTSRMNKGYKELRECLERFLGVLRQDLPEWDGQYDKADANYMDEDRILTLMRIDLNQEKTKITEAKRSKATWEAYLPPANEARLVGTNAISYRKERIKLYAEEEARHAYRVYSLEQSIKKQEEIVKKLEGEVIPSLAVANHARSTFSLLTTVEAMLYEEHVKIAARLPRRINSVKDEIWSSIFRFAVDMQEDDNRFVLLNGLPLDGLRSPRRVAVAISGVCQSWRRITSAASSQMLWQNILVEASNISLETLRFPISPVIYRPDNPLSVDLITQSAANFSDPIPPTLRWMHLFSITNLGIPFSDTPWTKISSIIHTAANRNCLQRLWLIQRGQITVEEVALPPSLFRPLQYLEFVDVLPRSTWFSLGLENLSWLCLRFNQPLDPGRRLSSSFLRDILYRCPNLQVFELDLGTEDKPLFAKPTFSDISVKLDNLRSLRTRASYLQNSLAFLNDLNLPRLRSLTLITIPSSMPPLEWDPIKDFLRRRRRGHRILDLEIGDTLPHSRGSVDAGCILEELPQLEALSLRRTAVELFVQYLAHIPSDRDMPVSQVETFTIWDSAMTGDALVNLIRIYVEKHRDSGSVGPQAPEGVMRTFEAYRCENVEASALSTIVQLLRGF